jgi:hypothetical protein
MEKYVEHIVFRANVGDDKLELRPVTVYGVECLMLDMLPHSVQFTMGRQVALALAAAIRLHYGVPIVPRNDAVCGRSGSDGSGHTHTCRYPAGPHSILTTAQPERARMEIHGCACGRSWMTAAPPELPAVQS